MIDKEQNIVNSIKILGLDMIDQASSGHPGIVLSAAPIIYTLYAHHLKFLSNVPTWINRDRFIMSAGHGSALLYATLYMSGFDITVEDLKKFRQIDSITPGHPEIFVTPGVDMTTGPLSQGIGSAVGIALGERYLRSLANAFEPEQKLIDYYTYVLVGDGDLMEGLSYEACSFAGTQKLGKLIVLYDSNDMTLDGSTNLTFNEDVQSRFESMGWHTQLIRNGEDVKAIDKAISRAKMVDDKPSLIEIKTILGSGSAKEGTNVVHGKVLLKEDLESLKAKLKITNKPFDVSNEALIEMRRNITGRVDQNYSIWSSEYNRISNSNNEDLKNLLNGMSKNKIEVSFDDLNKQELDKQDFRMVNNKIINEIANNHPMFIGGSADVISSTMTNIVDSKENSPINPTGRNIYFGVREHAMGAILNGLSTCGITCYGSAFLSFSNYLIPAIRMSCLMNLPITYIFTHDSITIGEDGPTHQPVEQINQLRSIPNLTVMRPADAKELIGSWKVILNDKKPTALIVAKGECVNLDQTDENKVAKGGYILKEEKGNLNGIIMATGLEVKYALLISDYLDSKNIFTRVVSIPSIELFLSQGREYKDSVLPSSVKRVAIEFGLPDSWFQFVDNPKNVIGVKDFGYSGKKEDVLKKFNLDFDNLKLHIEFLFNPK